MTDVLVLLIGVMAIALINMWLWYMLTGAFAHINTLYDSVHALHKSVMMHSEVLVGIMSDTLADKDTHDD